MRKNFGWRKSLKISLMIIAVFTLFIGCPLIKKDEGTTPSKAEFLPLDTWKEDEIGSGGVRWYKFRIEKPGQAVAQLVLTDNYCTYVRIYDTDQNTELVWRGTCTEGEAYMAEARYDLAVGEFYLKIEGQAGTGFKIRVKNKEVRWTPDDEPNDSDDEATKISPNKWITGAIGFYASGHRDTQDWYAVKVNSPSRLTATMNIDRDNCVYIYLYDKNGVDYLSWRGTCNETYSAKIDYYISKPGTYYLVVQSTNGAGYKFLYKLLK